MNNIPKPSKPPKNRSIKEGGKYGGIVFALGLIIYSVIILTCLIYITY